MKKNERIPDFGDLNRFFDEDVSPQDFMDELTDIIDEYSRLALMAGDQVIPINTVWHIGLLAGLHRELRKIVR